MAIFFKRQLNGLKFQPDKSPLSLKGEGYVVCAFALWRLKALVEALLGGAPQGLLALPVINYSSKNPELLPVPCLSKYLHIFSQSSDWAGTSGQKQCLWWELVLLVQGLLCVPPEMYQGTFTL